MGRRKKEKPDHIAQVMELAVKLGMPDCDYGKAMAYVQEHGGAYNYFGWEVAGEKRTEALIDRYMQMSGEELLWDSIRDMEAREREKADHPCEECGTIIPAGRSARWCCKKCYNASEWARKKRGGKYAKSKITGTEVPQPKGSGV